MMWLPWTLLVLTDHNSSSFFTQLHLQDPVCPLFWALHSIPHPFEYPQSILFAIHPLFLHLSHFLTLSGLFINWRICFFRSPMVSPCNCINYRQLLIILRDKIAGIPEFIKPHTHTHTQNKERKNKPS